VFGRAKSVETQNKLLGDWGTSAWNVILDVNVSSLAEINKKWLA